MKELVLIQKVKKMNDGNINLGGLSDGNVNIINDTTATNTTEVAATATTEATAALVVAPKASRERVNVNYPTGTFTLRDLEAAGYKKGTLVVKIAKDIAAGRLVKTPDTRPIQKDGKPSVGRPGFLYRLA
jgi:hypothetical protein